MRKRREIDVLIDQNTGQTSSDESNIDHSQKVVVGILPNVENEAQTNDVLVIDEIDGKERDLEDDVNDMEVAETHVFRPMFRYRVQLEQRRKVSQG